MCVCVCVCVCVCIYTKYYDLSQHRYTKYLHDPDNHDGVITHLEPDTLESKVKWTLGNTTTKLVEVMEFQLSYFNS